jgi:hypothetical protein
MFNSPRAIHAVSNGDACHWSSKTGRPMQLAPNPLSGRRPEKVFGSKALEQCMSTMTTRLVQASLSGCTQLWYLIAESHIRSQLLSIREGHSLCRARKNSGRRGRIGDVNYVKRYRLKILHILCEKSFARNALRKILLTRTVIPLREQ